MPVSDPLSRVRENVMHEIGFWRRLCPPNASNLPAKLRSLSSTPPGRPPHGEEGTVHPQVRGRSKRLVRSDSLR